MNQRIYYTNPASGQYSQSVASTWRPQNGSSGSQVAVVVGWLLARHFVGSGHPYVAVVVMFVIGLAVGAMLMSILRGVARNAD